MTNAYAALTACILNFFVFFNFNFGKLLGFAKPHHKIIPRGKVGVVLGSGRSQKFWGSPIILLQRLKLVTSNLVHGLGLPKAHHIITPIWKVGWPWARGTPQKFWSSPIIFLYWLKLATSNLAYSRGLPRTIIKSHREEKGAWETWVSQLH